LVDFLSEALAESDINNEAYFEAKFDKLTDKELEGKIFGWPVESFTIEIKAATYHGLEIKKVDDYWEAKVLFDI
jgi:SHS2 domain-containing protein